MTILKQLQLAALMLLSVTKGGPGSGNFGHSGRPGEVGGSGGEGGGESSAIGNEATEINSNLKSFTYPGAKIETRVSDRVSDTQGNDVDGVKVTVAIRPDARSAYESKTFGVYRDKDGAYVINDPDTGENRYAMDRTAIAAHLKESINSFRDYVKG